MTITMSFTTTMILFLLNVHSMFGITIKSRLPRENVYYAKLENHAQLLFIFTP
ncbi:hypothetical protein Tsp_07942 [Trichinella spiralis]|uniref:hypothetical protein n=1 Tax=Trichinella spiralis TaxID=6334 RepID=UPI0001EFD6E9|nr:hypothetical protein Tsp_07942 [Trichinella spiralis]